MQPLMFQSLKIKKSKYRFCPKRTGCGCRWAAGRREKTHSYNDPICSELGWKCAPLAAGTFGAWGKTAGQFFSKLAVRLAARSGYHHLRQGKSKPMLVLWPPVLIQDLLEGYR